MNHHINPAKAAITLGAFLGGLHIIWSILVASGWAQDFVDFILWAHMVSLPYVVVKAFDLSAAVTVIIITTIIGYTIGYAFARVWNRIHRG